MTEKQKEIKITDDLLKEIVRVIHSTFIERITAPLVLTLIMTFSAGTFMMFDNPMLSIGMTILTGASLAWLIHRIGERKCGKIKF